MCIAIPMEIVTVTPDGTTARARYKSSELDVDVRLVSAAPGDYVLVHAGCALEKMRVQTACELLGLLDELENADDRGPA